MRYMVGILGVLIALAVLCPTAWTAAPSPTANSWESYQGIVTGNIFSRERQRDRGDRQPSSRRSGPPEWVLTGIATCGDTPVAFFEENQSGQVVWAAVGTGVGGGEVLGLCLDSVNVRFGGTSRCVRVGQNIRGEASSMPSATGGAGAASAPSGPGSDVLERMRQRRLQEMR